MIVEDEAADEEQLGQLGLCSMDTLRGRLEVEQQDVAAAALSEGLAGVAAWRHDLPRAFS